MVIIHFLTKASQICTLDMCFEDQGLGLLVCIGKVISKGVDVMEICSFGGGLCPQKSLNRCLTTKLLSRFMPRHATVWWKEKALLKVFGCDVWNNLKRRSFQHCSANCKQTQLLLNEPYAAIVFTNAVSTAGYKFTNWLQSSFWLGGVKRVADIQSCLSHLSLKLDSDQSFLNDQNSYKHVQSWMAFRSTLKSTC